MYGDLGGWVGRWVVFRSLSMEGVEPGPPDEDGKRWISLGDGETAGFVVSTGNMLSQTPEDYEVEFGSEEEARAVALAEEFNRYEWQGPLDPEFDERRDRLRELASDFGGIYFEGPSFARLPVTPGRYLIRDGGVGWHAESSDTLAETLADVEAAIAEEESNVYEVIDLDTGDVVPFSRSISVEIGAPT